MTTVRVIDSAMAYAEAGTGDPAVVFLHGNPTSSYLQLVARAVTSEGALAGGEKQLVARAVTSEGALAGGEEQLAASRDAR